MSIPLEFRWRIATMVEAASIELADGRFIMLQYREVMDPATDPLDRKDGPWIDVPLDASEVGFG